MLQRAEKEIKIDAKHTIKVRELSMDDESKARSLSQVFDQRKKVFETDSSRFELEVILRSIVPESWPVQDFGALSLDNLKTMGAKYLRPILKAWKELNTLSSDASDFLEQQSQSKMNQRRSRPQ